MEFNGGLDAKLIPNPHRSLWADDQMFQMNDLFAQNYMETDARQTVVLYRVNLAKSGQRDALYGETDPNKVVFYPPVELSCVYEIDKPSLASYANGSSNNGVYMKPGKLTFHVLESDIEKLGADGAPKSGDYVGVLTGKVDMEHKRTEMYTFMIDQDGRVNPDNEHTLYGYKPLYRTYTASYVDGFTLN